MADKMPECATEEVPYYYYIHKPGDLMCECEWPRIWLPWPLECRNCGRILQSTMECPKYE